MNKIISIADDEDNKPADRLRALSLLAKITGLDKTADSEDIKTDSIDEVRDKLTTKLGALADKLDAQTSG